jgi:hypothetical protein
MGFKLSSMHSSVNYNDEEFFEAFKIAKNNYSKEKLIK